MAISITNKDQFTSNTNNQPSFTSDSWTPTANRLAIVIYQTSRASSTALSFSISGNSLSWSQVDSFKWKDTGSGNRYFLTVWVALTGSSPSTGAVTVTNVTANTNGGLIIIDEVDGADVSGTALAAIVQSKQGTIWATSGSATSESISLNSAITSGNASYGAMCHNASSGTNTQGTGYSPLGSAGVSTPGRIFSEYLAAGSTTVDFSWSTAGEGSGLGMEIKAAAVIPAATISTTLAKVTSDIEVSQEYTFDIVTILKKIRAELVSFPTGANEVWVETWEEQDP